MSDMSDVGPCWYCKRVSCDGCPICCPEHPERADGSGVIK